MDSPEFLKRWEEFIEAHGLPRPANIKAVCRWFHLAGKHDGLAGTLDKINKLFPPDDPEA